MKKSSKKKLAKNEGLSQGKKRSARKRYTCGPLPVNFKFPDPTQGSKITLQSIRLSGNQVELLDLRTSDIPDLERAAKQTTIFQWFVDGWLIIKGNVPAYVFHCLNEDQQGHSLSYAVFHRESRRVVGVTRFYKFDPKHKTALVSSWYAKQYQKSGINTEAKYLMMLHAFSSGIERLEFEVDVNNTDSVAAMRGIGAKREGIKENHMHLPDNRRRDSVIFAVTITRWEKRVKLLLERKLSRQYK